MKKSSESNQKLSNMLGIIGIEEKLAAELTGVSDEPGILVAIHESLLASEGYTAFILELTEDEAKFKPPAIFESRSVVDLSGEIPYGRPDGVQLFLDKSSVLRDVVRDGVTILIRNSELIDEVRGSLGEPMASPTLEFKADKIIITPLRQYDRIIGVFGFSSDNLDEFCIPLVKNLAHHISEALKLVRMYQDRQRTEDAMISVETRYRTVLESANDAIVTINGQGEVVFWNSAAETIFGYTSEEIVGHHFILVIPPQHHQIYRDEINYIVSKRKTSVAGKTINVTGLKKNGSEFPVELSLANWEVGEEPYVTTIIRDVSEPQRLKQNLQYYISGITTAHEEERKRIARELHDDTIQSLALLSLEIQRIIKNSKRSVPHSVIEDMKEVLVKADSILDRTRRLCHNLRPDVLDHLGLIPALEVLVNELRQAGNIETHLDVNRIEQHLPIEAEMALYRITQEALSNIRRHAEANKAMVQLDFSPTEVRLTVSDNGKGFELPDMVGDLASMGKLGLLGIQERARLIGADFVIKSYVGAGTILEVVIR